MTVGVSQIENIAQERCSSSMVYISKNDKIYVGFCAEIERGSPRSLVTSSAHNHALENPARAFSIVNACIQLSRKLFARVKNIESVFAGVLAERPPLIGK